MYVYIYIYWSSGVCVIVLMFYSSHIPPTDKCWLHDTVVISGVPACTNEIYTHHLSGPPRNQPETIRPPLPGSERSHRALTAHLTFVVYTAHAHLTPRRLPKGNLYYIPPPLP